LSKYKKVIVAGPLVIEAVYPAPHPSDSRAVRAGKKKLSSEARQRVNLRYAHQQLEILLAANFPKGSLVCVFSYDDEHLPPSKSEAEKRIKAFLRRLRAARKERGEIVNYIYRTECEHGDKRLHHHVVLNATGQDYEELSQLWGKGLVLHEPLQISRERNFGTLARYLCKEGRDKVGKRLWSSSHNLERPKPETYRVSNDTSILPPHDGITLEDTGDVVTAYGHFRYIKFIAPGWERQPKPKAKRQRQRRR